LKRFAVDVRGGVGQAEKRKAEDGGRSIGEEPPRNPSGRWRRSRP